MKANKGILIDPFTKTVKEIQVPNHWTEISKAIGGEDVTFTSAPILDVENESLYVDDNGLVVDDLTKQKFIYLMNLSPDQPMAGKGLILGMDEEGEAADTKITVEEVEKQIEWIDNIRFISDKIKLNAQQHGAQL